MTTAVGWIGATLILLAYAQTNLRRLRQVSVLGGLALLAFNIAMHVWPYVVLELVVGAINVGRLLELRGRPTIEARWPEAVPGPDPTPRRPSTTEAAPAAWSPPAPRAATATRWALCRTCRCTLVMWPLIQQRSSRATVIRTSTPSSSRVVCPAERVHSTYCVP